MDEITEEMQQPEDTQQAMMLSLHRKGTAAVPRWMIGDQFCRYWTGEEWHVDEDKAELFADVNVAATKLQDLMIGEYSQLPVRTFTAPLKVVVWSGKKYSRDDLMMWLGKVARLLVDNSQDNGLGPIPGSYGYMEIQWGGLKETPV